MKINLKIFKKEFFSLETEEEKKDPIVGVDFAKDKDETVSQMVYILGATQYFNLKHVEGFLRRMTGLKLDPNVSKTGLDNYSKELKESYDIISNLIKSYEHFEEKREALENESN